MSHASSARGAPPNDTTFKTEAAYTCPKCDKSFSRAVNRDRHLATHNKVPQLACSLCQRRFHRADVLAKHVQRHKGASQATTDAPLTSSRASRTTTPPRQANPAHDATRAAHPRDAQQDHNRPSLRSLAASRKVARACSRCSRAKVRCDGHQPACGRCVRLDKVSMCMYDALPEDTSFAASLADATSDPAQTIWPQLNVISQSANRANTDSRLAGEVFDPTNSTPITLNVPTPSTGSRQANFPHYGAESGNGSATHQHRLPDSFDLESWRQSQAQPTNYMSWSQAASPLPLDWLLQNEIPDDGWTAYLGDPGVPLLANFFDYPDPSASRPRPDMQPGSSSFAQHSNHAVHPLANGSATNSSHAFSDLARSPKRSSQPHLHTRTPQGLSAASGADATPSTTSPATMDAAAAAATLARIRSAAVHRGFLRSATPSDEDSASSRSSSPEPHANTAEHAKTRGDKLKRTRDDQAHPAQKRGDGPPSPRSPDSSSESTNLNPMERVNRDVAAQPRQQRVSYRHPDPSARGVFDPSAAAPSPEDVARQEAAAEEIAEQAQHAGLSQGRSPYAPSDRSSKRRKRKHKYWPSVYRPKATDGGRHLSLQKVPLASEEVTALENSYQVAPMTDLAKERMINEFRYCEVEAQDLQRIQDTLRSIETATLNLFVQLYFEHHDPILPILHRATFDPDTCDPLLLAAVTCLGALCSRAENAFAYSLLTSSLVHAVSYKLIGINHLRGRYLPSMQTLLLTYALWRNLGDPAKLEYVEGFRNIILTMARRCRLFELSPFVFDRDPLAESSLEPNDPDIIAAKREQEWQDWIRNQEMVRITWALLVLDSDLSLAWDLPCTVTIGEFRSPLPCVESLWQAESAEDWASMSEEQAISAQRSLLGHLLQTSGSGQDDQAAMVLNGSAQSASRKLIAMDARHTSTLTHLILSAAVHNVATSRWNLDTVLSQLLDSHDDEDSDLTNREMAVPRKDAEMEAWTDAITARLYSLTGKRLDSGAKGEAQVMLHGARLRMLVSFKAVQVMSGRKGYRRSKIQMKRWLQGPLQDEQYRNDIFAEASKIFTLSLAARRDMAPLNLESSTQTASNSSGRDRIGSRNSANQFSERGGNSSLDSGSSNIGHAGVSGTGAENSILFYATVCLALLCQSLVQSQTLPKSGHAQSEPPTEADSSTDAMKPTLVRSTSVSRKTRKKDVYFLPGVGALNNSVSLDRLVHVAVNQGLNRSAWPLGNVLGKVLQQWARTLAR